MAAGHPCAELLFNCRIRKYASQPVIYLEVTCCFGINVADNVFFILKIPAVKQTKQFKKYKKPGNEMTDN
jgi:hypothetical protein